MNNATAQAPPLTHLMLESLTPLAHSHFALAVPWMLTLPRGDGHAVLVLPPMLGNDEAMRHVSWFLRSRGYKVLNWGMGRNRGPRPGVFDLLLAKLKAEKRSTGQKTSLIGWSLGGTLARVLANRHPELVRTVVTLASPLTGDRKASQLNWLYTLATGHSPGSHASFLREYSRTPDVPLTAIYTPIDGVLAWRSTYQQPGPLCESIQVLSTHGAIALHPLVMYVLANRLSQAEGAWQHFATPWWFKLANGKAASSGFAWAAKQALPAPLN